MGHTLERLAEDLHKMGIKEGDALMVHSSLKSIGWVQGGADTVIDAILSVIGEEGVLFVPTLTETIHPPGDDAMHKYAWDPKETPSRVGKITDTLWRRPNAHRSDHSTHSVAAIGKDAAELVKGHGEGASTFDKRGPYGGYVKLGATILFVGTEMGPNTTLHVSEDWAELPYMMNDVKARVKTADGERPVVCTMFPGGSRSFYTRDANSPPVQLFYRLGLVREAKLGDATVQLIGAQDVINTMLKTYYDGDPAFLLLPAEKDEFSRKGREDCERELPRIRKTIEQLADDGWCRLD